MPGFAPTSRFIAAALVLSLLAAARAEEPAPEELKQAVEQLSSDLFLDREKATARLLEAGTAAIPFLEAAVAEGELETVTRALRMIQSLALESDDVAAREAAIAAVHRLAAAKTPAVAERAQAAAEEIHQRQKAEAIAHLERMGAKLEEKRTLVAPVFLPAQYSLEIGPEWRGGDDDLKLLALLDDLTVISLVGEKATDAWLAHVAAVESLQSLTLKKTKVTAEGINRLQQLKELVVLDVLYTPLEDGALAPVKEMKQLSLVRLFGTKVSKEGAAKLAADLPNAKIDLRRGGFCGIGVQAHTLGCIVSNVQPGSSADRAGLEIGDLILSFAGESPKNFEELTQVIAKYQPGNEVELELYRGEGREKIKIALGEWE